MEHLATKKELVEWLINLEDDDILNKISELKNTTKPEFKSQFENGLTIEEFRREIRKRLKSYSLKKWLSSREMSLIILMI